MAPPWRPRRATRCTINLACATCYIESSPTNDALVYIAAKDVARFLDEIESEGMETREIGFTGGEPFMNPDMLAMLEDTLGRGFEALVLTNAMKPMRRHEAALVALREAHGDRLTLRVSLDHHTQTVHEAERGPRLGRVHGQMHGAVTGHADNRVIAQHCARFGVGRIVLSDMDSVAAGLDRQIRPVVHQQGHVMGPGDRAQRVAGAPNDVVINIF